MNFSKQYEPVGIEGLAGVQQRAALKSLLENEPKHSVLFTGSSGTGKTTVGRLYAAHLLEVPVGELSDHVDFQHVNSREVGIDYFRNEVLANLHFPPQIGKYKVYFFDEVEGLKKESEQPLLLTYLENLPDHVILLFATLKPEKLRADFLSRLKPHFAFSPPSLKEQKRLMMRVFGQADIVVGENIAPETANEILVASGGNLRSLLDNIQAFKEGVFVVPEKAKNAPRLAKALLDKNRKKVCISAKETTNYNSALHGICSYAIAVITNNPEHETAYRLLKIFGKGLNPQVSEKVAFWTLIAEYLTMT